MKKTLVVIGAGPAGLACASELTVLRNVSKASYDVIVLDKNEIVGGLARTYKYKGHYFDIGPHRFYTKNTEIQKFWEDLLPGQFFKVRRYTRILYNNILFQYPLNLVEILLKIGFVSSMNCLCSYLYWRMRLWNTEPKTFEQWVIKHFGKRLYGMFFKSYTEKVWGIDCDKLDAKWAKQRIRNLNIKQILLNVLHIKSASEVKSLTEEFYYPSFGAGQMYAALAKKIVKNGGTIINGATVTSLHKKNNSIQAITYKKGGKRYVLNADFVFSSMPITEFISVLSPKPDLRSLRAASLLRYRDHITVNLIVKGVGLFPDQWIYVHNSDVKMARIANYNNFSPHRGSFSQNTAISVEYFTFRTDSLWQMNDDALIRLAKQELSLMNLVKQEHVLEGIVVREPDSYPMYFEGYFRQFELVKRYCEGIHNAKLIGRGGMYRYNNMDHSMLDGLRAARTFAVPNRTISPEEESENSEYVE